MGKVSTLAHFPLEPGCGDYSFWSTQLRTLSMVFTPSSLTPSKHQNWMHPLVRLRLGLHQCFQGFYAWLVWTELWIAPRIKSHKLWCQTRALFHLYCRQERSQSFKLIHYLSSHPAAFGFQALSPPDNISLNPVNKKSLYDFEMGIHAAAHATLDTNQLISHTSAALIDRVASL